MHTLTLKFLIPAGGPESEGFLSGLFVLVCFVCSTGVLEIGFLHFLSSTNVFNIWMGEGSAEFWVEISFLQHCKQIVTLSSGFHSSSLEISRI